MMVSDNWPSGNTMLPDLLRTTPEVRPVLDQYGLRGCGGRFGPAETIEFFSRAHDVPLSQLLDEIREAIQLRADTQPHSPAIADCTADTIYRPFFKAGIAVVLTLGGAWGALLLLRIAWSGDFSALSIHEVNAHGHAQIFGWVGLFVMGFAYQAFPRFKHTSLSHPKLAYASFWMMLVGLVTRSIAQGLMNWAPWLGAVGILASVVEILAIGMMLFVILSTLRHSSRRLEAYDYYILAALGWFFVQAVGGTAYFAATLLAADRHALLALVATWQAPLREIQIHGFATLMILGVSQRLFHFFYGLPRPNARKSFAVLPVFNAALVGMVLGFVLMRTSGHAWAGLWYLSILVLTTAVAYLVSDWKLFSPPEETDRSLKFLRTAYVWLFVSLLMLVLLPVHQLLILPWLAPQSSAATIGFSHAYYGAIRHAITVGFISFMIVGVAAKVVPTLNGINVRNLSGLWGTYALLLTGCTLRVVGQTLTDFTDQAFPFAGISGFLELTGLAIWSFHLLWLMKSSRRTTNQVSALTPNSSDSAIHDGQIVASILQRYPWLLETFVAFGFEPLKNPILRNTVARWTTVAQAARKMDVELDTLLDALNRDRRNGVPDINRLSESMETEVVVSP